MNFLSASVDIKVDDSKLRSQLGKAKSLTLRTVDKIKAAFGRMATSFKAAFDKIVRYAKYGAIIIVGALALMTRAAMRQEDVMAKLVSTLKSTGYAARLTASQLFEQARALQSITVYGDEAIIELQTLLLTFKAISGDTFRRATLAILDMSTAMGQDLKQGAIQVGKALNDPILGVTALRRVGVQLTAQQEQMIKMFVETNQIAKAQKIILGELESQFGGMSQVVETGTGKWAQMKNALGDVYERIGDALLPAFKDSMTAIKQWAERNEERIGYWARVTVVYIAYVKDIMVSFMKFMQEDWKAGFKYATDISLILVKEFANQTVQVFIKLGRRIEDAIADSIGPAMVRGWEKAVQALRQSRVGRFLRWPSLKLEELTGLGKGPVSGPPTEEELIRQGYLYKNIPPLRQRLEAVTPPELKVRFDEAAEKLKAALAGIERKAEGTGEKLKEALVEPVKEAARVSEEELAKIHDVMVEEWQRQQEEAFHAMRAPIIAVEKLARESATRRKRIAEDIAASMASSWAGALSQMMLDGKSFVKTMKDMFQDLLRTIIQIIIYRKIAEPIAYGVMGLPVPSAQHGGTVEKTGLAVIHKGETYSGVGGGNFEINITYAGQERPEITEAQSYMVSNRRILDVTMQAMQTNLQYRRSIKQIRL